jgi:hypothetical protein
MAVTQTVTLNQLQKRILTEANRSVATYGTQVNNAIVTAIKYMEFNHPWLFQKQTDLGSFVVPAGLNEVALPDDFNSVIAVRYLIGNLLYGEREGFLGITYAELSDYYNLVNMTGQPMRWAIFNASLFIYPNVPADTTFKLIYYYKDKLYPAPNPINIDDPEIWLNPTSIWFQYDTVDAIRYLALSIFYSDTLQAPEIGETYMKIFKEWQKNLVMRNNHRNVSNLLTI